MVLVLIGDNILNIMTHTLMLGVPLGLLYK